MMTLDEYHDSLTRDGYDDAAEKHLEAGFHADEHAHPFDVRALVIEGAITLTCDGKVREYVAGEHFNLAANRPHVEDAGDNGVRVLIGRRPV